VISAPFSFWPPLHQRSINRSERAMARQKQKLNILYERPALTLADVSAMDLKDHDMVREPIAAVIRQCHPVTLRNHRRRGIGVPYSQDPDTGRVLYKVGDLRAAFERDKVDFSKRSPEAQRFITNQRNLSNAARVRVETGEPVDPQDCFVEE
jgi:hypothetical protein